MLGPRACRDITRKIVGRPELAATTACMLRFAIGIPQALEPYSRRPRERSTARARLVEGGSHGGGTGSRRHPMSCLAGLVEPRRELVMRSDAFEVMSQLRRLLDRLFDPPTRPKRK